MKKISIIFVLAVMVCGCAVPAFAAPALADAASVYTPDAILDLFPTLFDGIVYLFQVPPITYLLGILMLAFIILIIKTIKN